MTLQSTHAEDLYVVPVDDAIAYDLAREAAMTLVGQIASAHPAGTPEHDRDLQEAIRLRQELLAVDGRDRRATEAFHRRIHRRPCLRSTLTPFDGSSRARSNPCSPRTRHPTSNPL